MSAGKWKAFTDEGVFIHSAGKVHGANISERPSCPTLITIEIDYLLQLVLP